MHATLRSCLRVESGSESSYPTATAIVRGSFKTVLMLLASNLMVPMRRSSLMVFVVPMVVPLVYSYIMMHND